MLIEGKEEPASGYVLKVELFSLPIPKHYQQPRTYSKSNFRYQSLHSLTTHTTTRNVVGQYQHKGHHQQVGRGQASSELSPCYSGFPVARTYILSSFVPFLVPSSPISRLDLCTLCSTFELTVFSPQASTSSQEPKSPTRFAGLMNQKRNSTDASVAARRASWDDQRPTPGFLGGLWNKYTKGS